MRATFVFLLFVFTLAGCYGDIANAEKSVEVETPHIDSSSTIVTSNTVARHNLKSGKETAETRDVAEEERAAPKVNYVKPRKIYFGKTSLIMQNHAKRKGLLAKQTNDYDEFKTLRESLLTDPALRKDSEAAAALRKDSEATAALRKDSEAAAALRKDSEATAALRKDSEATAALRKDSEATAALRKDSEAAAALRKDSEAAAALRKASTSNSFMKKVKAYFGQLGMNASPAEKLFFIALILFSLAAGYITISTYT